MSSAPIFVKGLPAQRAALAVAGLGALAVAIGLVQSPERTWSNLLLGDLYVLFACLAGSLLLSLHYLSGAGWSAVLRRVPEAMMAGLPLFGLLAAIVVVVGRYTLSGSDIVGGEPPLPPGKAAYLGATAVLARAVVIVCAWSALARGLRRTSLAQDGDPAPAHHRQLVRYSAVFAVVFAISFSVASTDWLMSLDPHWSSTVFAVYVFAGLLVMGLAVMTLIVVLLQERGLLDGIAGPSHLHDLGKLLFAFTTFWAYIWLSQYLLIWYANLPEEVPHYVRRTEPGWAGLFILNLAVNWIVPFLVLLPRAAKRNRRVLKWLCVLLLCGRWLDLYLLIMPEVQAAPAFGPLELLVPLGCAGVFFLVTSRALAQAPLVAVNDLYLEESLQHHT